MAKTITTIPATIRRNTAKNSENKVKRKVAAYARVSTDMEEQLTSYEAQISYYTEYIKSREDWEFAGIYTDEGITGTSTKYREGFKRMVADALDGKIDLIITKSVSRFARNTVDSLTAIRKLKDRGTECYFEKENIWTMDSKGELLITIMSSLAQEESRSISENTKWGHRKRFADGKVSLAYSSFLGYEKGEEGNLTVNRGQAEIVRLIYRMYLSGFSFYSIASELTKREIRSPTGKEKWFASTVKSILTNEKYKGDALLQKKFTVDYLTKKLKKNEGEVPQYYVEDNHEAIISGRVFELVQNEMRKRTGLKCSGTGIFSAKIKCGECGGWYGSKVWHSTDKYRRVIYQCNSKFEGHKKCETPHITEEEIKDLFVQVLKKLIISKNEVVNNIDAIEDMLGGSDEVKLQRRNFIDALKKQGGNGIEFDERLWSSLVECVTVHKKDNVVFMFRDGRQIKV